MKKDYIKILFGILIAVMCIGVILLLWVGVYNVPSSDDYGYAIWTHQAWESSHSLIEVMKQAIFTSEHFWNHWQGLYSSAFVLAFMPNVFGEGAYAVTAFITIAFMVVGNTLIINAFSKKVLAAKPVETGILVVVLNFITLQWMPSAVEGIYWYNGAMNYTFFYALMLLEFTVIIYYGFWQSVGKDIVAVVGLSLLGIIITGGNHVTALLLLVVLLVVSIAGFVAKKRKLQLLLIPFVASVTGFIFNVTSPGTKVRQAAFSERPGFAGTILLSIEKTLKDLNDWLDFSLILVLIILGPILLMMAVRVYKNSKFQFSYPLLVVIASVACLCILRCPTYYAMGKDGAGRVDNVVYFVFVLLSVLNEFYLLGWLHRKNLLQGEENIKLSGATLACMILLLAVSFYGSKEENNFYEAYHELKTGEVQQYGMESEARWEILLDPANTDVVLQPYNVKPKLLYFSDIKKDPTDGKNSSMTQFYGKNSVRLKKKKQK